VTRHPWKLPVIAGVVLACGYYPIGLVVPNIVAFVPLLAWIDGNLDRPWRAWRNAGFVFGLTVHLLALSWMRSMLRVSFLGIFAYLGLALVFAVGITLAVVAMTWLRRTTRWPWAVLLPACWLSLEWVQAQGDLRMTAQHIAQALGDVPFVVQFADLGGPYGVGLVLLLSSVLLYEAWRATSRRGRAAALATWTILIVAVLAYDGWAWTHPPKSERTVRVSFIQPNVGLFEKMDPANDDAQTDLLARLTRAAVAEHPDIVVWPETARPKPIYHRPGKPETYAMPEVQALARELGVTIVTGAEYVIPLPGNRYDAWNAAHVVHPDGTLDPRWSAKVVLVPFVEGIPFRPVLGPLLSGRDGWMRWLAGGFKPGRKATTLSAAGVEIGVTVCYEELFFDLHRALRNAGADVQFVITNDAWFGKTFFQAYQANTVRLRAIENRTSFVRVANSGISMFVDPLGRDADRTELDVEAVHTRDVPIVETRTVYDRIGNVVAWARLRCWVRRRCTDGGGRDDAADQRDDVGAVSVAGPGEDRRRARAGRHDRGSWSNSSRHRHDHPRRACFGPGTQARRARRAGRRLRRDELPAAVSRLDDRVVRDVCRVPLRGGCRPRGRGLSSRRALERPWRTERRGRTRRRAPLEREEGVRGCRGVVGARRASVGLDLSRRRLGSRRSRGNRDGPRDRARHDRFEARDHDPSRSASPRRARAAVPGVDHPRQARNER
jgi:apolipoprotein N-acyltransferase